MIHRLSKERKAGKDAGDVCGSVRKQVFLGTYDMAD